MRADCAGCAPRRGATGPTGAIGPTGPSGDSGEALGARVWSNVSQTLDDGGPAFVNFFFDPDECFDSGGFFNGTVPTRLTAPVNGIYSVTANLAVAAGAVGTYTMAIVVNQGAAGTITDFSSVVTQTGTPSSSQIILLATTLVALNAGDFVRLWLEGSNGALTVQRQLSNSPVFSIGKVG